MHCPNCGDAVNKKLRFCKSCGERLSKADEIDKDGTPGKMLDNILTTIFLVVMFGLGILVGLVAVLLGNNLNPTFVTMIAIAYLAAVFGICFMLLRQVPKLVDARLKVNNLEEDFRERVRLAPPSVARLDEYREPAMSITDRTTKTLDRVPLSEPPA